MTVEPGCLSTVWRKWEIECFGAEKKKYDQVSPMIHLVLLISQEQIELGLVPNENSLFNVFRPLIIFPIPVNNCHIISSFFCDTMVIFAIFGPKIHLAYILGTN